MRAWIADPANQPERYGKWTYCYRDAEKISGRQITRL
jgi:hypothetical protein